MLQRESDSERQSEFCVKHRERSGCLRVMNFPKKANNFIETWQFHLWWAFVAFFITLIVSSSANATAPPSQDRPHAPILPPSEPLLQVHSEIPEGSDGAFQVWKDTQKYFLVVTVDQTGPISDGLALPRVDGGLVAHTFNGLGYKPLSKQYRVLKGEQSTRENVMAGLKEFKKLAPPAIVIIYYSGHAVTSKRNSNLWLQLSGQDPVGSDQGLTLEEVVMAPRKMGYHGELVVILDASFSGDAPLSEVLELTDLGEQTIVFGSSNVTQNAQALRLPHGHRSAFTNTLLKALDSDWSSADQNRDGILRFSELNFYARTQLKQHFQKKDISKLMTPILISSSNDYSFVGYKRGQVYQWLTDDRQNLQLRALERALTPTMSRETILAKTSSGKLEVSNHASLLAQYISSDTNDLYTKGLLSLAQGSLKEARTILADAANKEGDGSRKLGQIYLARGRTEIYAGRIRLALVWYKKSLALHPPVNAKLLNEFGLVWIKGGLYGDALPFLVEALRLREKTVGPMDSSLAVSLNNLAGLYHKLGKFAEAEPLYQRALQISENAPGPENQSLAIPLNNLARLYRDEGRFADAEPLYQRVLAITERSLGPEHPKVATALNNVALVYRAQGRYAEAEPIARRVVQINEKALGPTHPKVAYELNNLALIYRAQGKLAEAEPVYQRLVEIDEVTLGPNHPEVATDLNNLAELYRAQGKYSEAEPLYQRSYDIYRSQLGLKHIMTRTVLNNYVRMLNKSGQTEKALRIKEEDRQALHNQHNQKAP